MDIADFLRQLNLFKRHSDESIKHLVKRLKRRSFRAGKAVIRRGEPGDCMFIIISGEVRVPILDAKGEQDVVVNLGPGQIFGEMALLTGEPRSADVICSVACKCLVFSRDTVEELVREHPEVARFLTAILGSRLMSVGGIQQVGKYRLIRELGRGGMATVFEGIHPTLERPVAIKMLSHEMIYHEHFTTRFRNEAKVIAQLRHPNIVEIFDTEEAYATFFIVMEKLTGLDLEKVLKTRGTIPPKEVGKILTDVASALHFAHTRGIIHRDVKSANIILSPEGSTKLMDFGLALIPNVEELLNVDPRVSLGTPNYMAPEQIQGKTLDSRIDIYALGIVAFEMLTGSLPFTGEVNEVFLKHIREPMPLLRDINPDIPENLQQFVAKATAKKPEDRYQSCQEIVDFFENVEHKPGWTGNVRVKTLTFVYDPIHEQTVQNLLDQVKSQAQPTENLIIE